MDLSQIKRHPYYPFREFRTNDLAFLLLEFYWAELFRVILSDDPSGAEHLDDWQTSAPADRADGDPMLYVVNRSLPTYRTLRIVQRFNTSNLIELDLNTLAPVRFTGDAYVGFVPDLTYGAVDDDGVTPVQELMISSDVSDACERLGREWIRKWCVEQVPIETMQAILDAYWTRIRSSLIEVP